MADKSRLQGIYDKEQSAGRDEYAELAVEEAERRGIFLEREDHARKKAHVCATHACKMSHAHATVTTKAPALKLEQRYLIDATLTRYGATLTEDGFIAKPADKPTNVQVGISKGRMRMSGRGVELASYPTSRIEAGVKDFVENFWFWKPTASI